MTTSNVTQSTVRVVSNANANAVVTQTVIRVISSSLNRALITQNSIRVVSSNTPDITASARPQVFVCT